MHTNQFLFHAIDMKTSTKILLVLAIVLLVPSVFLSRYVFATISANGSGFAFAPSALGWVGLACQIASVILCAILFFKFVKSQGLANAIFFSAIPLTLIYSTFVCGVISVQNLEGETAQALRQTLKISQQQNFAKVYLWIGLATLIYFTMLFLVIRVSCRPLGRVAKITKKLGDGRTRSEDFRLGGGKQFRDIESSLNKINYNIKDKEKMIRKTNLQSQKAFSKQFLKLFDQNSIAELEFGNKVSKKVAIMCCDLKINSSQVLSLEENFAYINSYLKVVLPLVKRYDGFVDKQMGDSILAVFGRAEQAIECAHAILRAVEVKNKNQKNLLPLDARVVINWQTVDFGLVGEDDKHIPAIVSDDVSVLKNMQETNVYLGAKLTVSQNVLNQLPQKYDFNHRYVGDLTTDDKKIALFESLDCYSKSKKDKLKKIKQKFEAGVRAYNCKKYAVAKENFEYVLHCLPQDKPAFVYFNKVNEKLKEVA